MSPTPRCIVVGIDFTSDSLHALGVVRTLLRGGSERPTVVHLLHVLPLPVGSFGISGVAPVNAFAFRLSEELEIARSRLVALAAAELDGMSAELVCDVRTGAAAHEILDLARDAHAELIVLGAHAHHGLGRLLLGSTLSGVMKAAPCSVLTTRDARALG